MPLRAVILSGGLGTRLKPFTQIIPKPLLPIGEKSVLEIQIERLKKYGIRDIYLATNYKSEYIENFFGTGKMMDVNLTISKEKIPLGTAGPIKLLEKELTEPFIAMNGDVLSLIDFEKFYEFGLKKNTDLTVAIKELVTPFAFGNIHFNGDYVTEIEEKPNIVMYALAGIYFLRPELLRLVPDNEYYGIDNLMLKMLNQNMPIAKYDLREYWLDIGQVDDYEEAQSAYQNFLD